MINYNGIQLHESNLEILKKIDSNIIKPFIVLCESLEHKSPKGFCFNVVNGKPLLSYYALELYKSIITFDIDSNNVSFSKINDEKSEIEYNIKDITEIFFNLIVELYN